MHFPRMSLSPIERLHRAACRIPPLRATLTAPVASRAPAVMARDVALALVWGTLCHAIFTAAVLAMVVGLWTGMTWARGAVPWPWAVLANGILLVQFPVVHSLLLGAGGGRVLSRLAPARAGRTLATTTYAIIASLQLLALFVLWTPSGIVWWRAEGAALWVIGVACVASWLLLMKASWDAGAEVQSGLLGWLSLARGVVRPVFPPMPVGGLFRLVRQPIYVSFALTTWTVSVWTPDQLAVAMTLTLYCLAGPLLKERRFAAAFGKAWADYRARTPYWLPRLR